MIEQKLVDAYNDAQTTGGFFVLPERCWLELTGEDRIAFLHNFCTADIKQLENGCVTELFILDRRGKTLAFGHVFGFADRLLITTADAGHAETLSQHLEMYVIREDVVITNRTNQWQSLFLAGARLSPIDWLPQLATNQAEFAGFQDMQFLAAYIEIAGFGTLIAGPSEYSEPLLQTLETLEIPRLPYEIFEMLRIQNGTPAFGREVDENNLPQEVRRDEKAISFTKGCYLGQETVAKIDAFGNVNRFMVGLQIDSVEKPKKESEISVDEKKVGILKSVVYSPILEKWLGLGFVKCKLAEPGATVFVGDRQATTIALPVANNAS